MTQRSTPCDIPLPEDALQAPSGRAAVEHHGAEFVANLAGLQR